MTMKQDEVIIQCENDSDCPQVYTLCGVNISHIDPRLLAEQFMLTIHGQTFDANLALLYFRIGFGHRTPGTVG